MNKSEFESLANHSLVTDDIIDDLISLLIQNQIISYESIQRLILESAKAASKDHPEIYKAYQSRLDIYQGEERLRLVTQLAGTINELNKIQKARGEPSYKLIRPTVKTSE
ncbi:hypothetical protein [Cedecea sp. NFIX57]|uniref:hypothetical protein n=1 Tax=Cedecea sp. NFIX57 TaxID=1566286 RepID=UPI000A097A6A|nr:hypothetical protein [Cedecea sp. NFIX57]SMG60808.1 hypothetical protein SAMN03159353_103930 [Cedecea sp. NFIX57]